MRVSRRTDLGPRLLRGVLAAAVAFSGAELATRLAYNEATVRAKVVEAARRTEPTSDQAMTVSRVPLVAAGVLQDFN